MFWRGRYYDVLPALRIRGRELRVSLNTVTAAWMFGVVWMSCVYGSHIKSYARILGFNDLAFGIMAAIPWLANFGQIVATIIVERTGMRKLQFIVCTAIHRMAWLALAAVPLLLPMPSTAAVVAVLVVLGVSQFMAALGAPGWFTWMGDLIPRRIRGRYMANRDRLTKVVQVAAVIVLGIILDAATVKGAPETAEAQPMLLAVICVILVMGSVFGVIDILLFLRIREVLPAGRDAAAAPDPAIAKVPRRGGPLARLVGSLVNGTVTVAQVVLGPLTDRIFRRYVAYGIVMMFAMTVGGWYWWLLAMEHLGFSKLETNILFMALGPVAGIISAKGWGRLIDRWGRRPVLMIATAGLLFTVLPWFVVRPDSPAPALIVSTINWLSCQIGGLFGHPVSLIGPATPLGALMLVALGCLLGGACWTGVHLAQMGIMLGFADSEGRTRHVAAAAVLISVGGVLGGLIGGLVTQALSFMQDSPLGPFLWNNWHAAASLSLAARIVGLCLLINMPDPGAGRVRDMVRLMRMNVYNAVAPHLYYGARLLGLRRRRP